MRKSTPPHLLNITPDWLAQVLTPALLNPARDDAPPAPRWSRHSAGWLRWSESTPPFAREDGGLE